MRKIISILLGISLPLYSLDRGIDKNKLMYYTYGPEVTARSLSDTVFTYNNKQIQENLEKMYRNQRSPLISPGIWGPIDIILLHTFIIGPSVLILAKNMYNDLMPFLRRAYHLAKHKKKPSKQELQNVAVHFLLRYGIPISVIVMIGDQIVNHMTDEIVYKIPYYISSTTAYLSIMTIILENLLIWYGPEVLARGARRFYRWLKSKIPSRKAAVYT